jgi:hypothetical protein
LPGRQLLGEFESVHGMLLSLSCEFMSSQMLSFAVRDSSSGVSMRREVMEFCGSIVNALGHQFLPCVRHVSLERVDSRTVDGVMTVHNCTHWKTPADSRRFAWTIPQNR